jgi:5-methylcytosine-specific restriction endonuclease McrA
MKLTIELVPKTSFYVNIRSILSRREWELIRKDTLLKANNLCEICGGVSATRALDCHEVWEYDDINHIQKLIRFIALCNRCHEVKHIGKAQIDGNFDRAQEWFKEINNFTNLSTTLYIVEAFDLWAARSQYQWQIDISILEEYKK